MNERKIKNIMVKALDKLNNHRYNSTYIGWMKGLKLPDKPVPGEREWPFRFQGYYGDKNMFDKVMPKGVFPPTVLRRMYGCYYDADYKRIALDDNSLAELLKNAMGGGKKENNSKTYIGDDGRRRCHAV